MFGDNNGGMGELTQMMKLMQSEGGISEFLQQPAWGAAEGEDPTISTAALLADVINFARLDAKRMAEEQGVDMSITRITPEQVGMMLEGLVRGESLEIAERFGELEARRELVLDSMLDDEEMETHLATKERFAFGEYEQQGIGETGNPELDATIAGTDGGEDDGSSE